METKYRKRLRELSKGKIPTLNARMMRGDMQDRLFRQEVIRYGKEKAKKDKRDKKIKDSLGMPSDDEFGVIESIEEPIFRRIRSVRGFF